jgi:GntR family transcriptional regulator, rspAB operon transcriptional repressor
MTYLTKHPDAKLLVNLEKNLEEQKRQIDLGVVDEEFYKIDSRFHEFCMISNNKHKVWQLIQQMDVHYSRYRLLDYMATRSNHVFETLYAEHYNLYELIKDRKTEKLKKAITSHLYGGFLRINTRFKTEYPQFFINNIRTIEDILLEIKLMVNEADT